MRKPFGQFLLSAFWMVLSAVYLRAVGMVFNRYLAARLGTAGVGRMTLLLSVYGFAVTLAASGMHLAVTRVTAELRGRGSGRGVGEALRRGILYALFCGGGACILLFLFSAPLSVYILKEDGAVTALRLLSFSLPFLAVSNVLGGYAVGMQKASRTAVSGMLAQTVRAVSTVLFLKLSSAENASTALAGGILLSEAAGCLFSVLLLPENRMPSDGAMPEPPPAGQLLRIAIPIALTTYLRTGLLTLEQLLIPWGLTASGASAGNALSEYGTVHGLALPCVLFPAAFLSAVSGLLIPEIAKRRVCGGRAAYNPLILRALRITICFSVLTAGVMRCFAGEIAACFCGTEAAEDYVRILAALIPVMYTDTVTDAALKGLDEQLASMRYNIWDAALSVVCVVLLLPRCGVGGYLFMVFATELFNFGLSMGRLLMVTGLCISVPRHIVPPLFSAILAGRLTAWFLSVFRPQFRYPFSAFVAHTLIYIVFYGAGLMVLSRIFSAAEQRNRKPCRGFLQNHRQANAASSAGRP